MERKVKSLELNHLIISYQIKREYVSSGERICEVYVSDIIIKLKF